MFGLTNTGFNVMTLQDLKSSVKERLKARLGADFNVADDSVIMQFLNGPLVELGLLWGTLGALHKSLDPAQATGEALDQIARLNGIARLGARRATGTIDATGTPGTIIPAGSRALNPTTQVTVETTAQATLDGAGEATIAVRAIEAGPVNSAINAITQIITPVAGWASITASSALAGGRFKEDDADLRARLAVSTADGAVATEDAIKSALLRLEYVTSALVTSNRGLVIDADLTPPKTVRAVISPDLTGDTEAEQAIVDALFRTLPNGIPSVGVGPNARSAVVLNQDGYEIEIGWEYPTNTPIYVDVDAVVDLNVGPLTVEEAKALIDEALTAQLVAQQVGQDVLLPDLLCALRDGVPGLRDATILFGTSPSPVGSAPVVVAFNRRATKGGISKNVVAA